MKKRKKSEALAFCIKHSGFEMYPCSRYKQQNTTYIVSNKEKSGRCSNYVCHKVKCNVKGIPVRKWRFLKVEEDCLEREREAVLAIYKAALRTAMKSMAQAKRLKKQQKFLKLKGKDIVCHSLKTLNKLEEAEEKEKQIELERVAIKVAATAYASAFLKPDPFAKIKIPLLLLKVWEDWDFASKTLQVS